MAATRAPRKARAVPAAPTAPPLAAVALATALALLTALGASGCTHWHYQPEVPARSVAYAHTRDGWTLALHHFPAAVGPGVPRRRHPVLLCHGITSNRFTWDVAAQLSLPATLARAGFDTWAVELRASGASDRPGWFDARDYDYTFDDYALKDVPALIGFVREQTGAASVHWVGHSLGGMVMYAYLQRREASWVQSFTAVASPPYAADHGADLGPAMGLVPVLTWLLDAVPAGKGAALVAPFAGAPWVPQAWAVWNYDNLDPAVARLMAANAVDDISGGVIDQIEASREPRALRSVDGDDWDYTAGLARIRTPTLLLAGSLDHLAPPAIVMEAYDRIGSADKRLVVLSRANGFAHDYGHVDLTVGRGAPAEVFPLVRAWLEAHD